MKGIHVFNTTRAQGNREFERLIRWWHCHWDPPLHLFIYLHVFVCGADAPTHAHAHGGQRTSCGVSMALPPHGLKGGLNSDPIVLTHNSQRIGWDFWLICYGREMFTEFQLSYVDKIVAWVGIWTFLLTDLFFVFRVFAYTIYSLYLAVCPSDVIDFISYRRAKATLLRITTITSIVFCHFAFFFDTGTHYIF